MKRIIITNFSRSEYAMHIPVFKALAPLSMAEFTETWQVKDKEINGNDLVLVGCMAEERKALEVLLLLEDMECAKILYCERQPSPLFLLLMQKMQSVSLLVSPENMEEIQKCSQAVLKNRRYISKAGQDTQTAESLGRSLDYSSLNRINRLLVYGIFEGVSLKEFSVMTGKSESYIKTSIARLKERFSVLERRELFVSLIKWISLDKAPRQMG